MNKNFSWKRLTMQFVVMFIQTESLGTRYGTRWLHHKMEVNYLSFFLS
jgi:hypothetical protein